METYKCFSCGCAIAEDDYYSSRFCPVCDAPLQRALDTKKYPQHARKHEKEESQSKKD